jgi:hypothetical protein
MLTVERDRTLDRMSHEATAAWIIACWAVLTFSRHAEVSDQSFAKALRRKLDRLDDAADRLSHPIDSSPGTRVYRHACEALQANVGR